MSYNVTRFELDLSGFNPDNKIVDEPHTLSNSEVRSLCCNYGPFFAESVKLIDDADKRELKRGVDYQIVELNQELTLKSLNNKEVSSIILILNKNVSSKVILTCQIVGGHYTYTDYAVANMYNSLLKLPSVISWKNVTNKPSEYPPRLHRHLLEDVYGFEAVVDGLERIKRSLTLSQVGVIKEILDGIASDFDCKTALKIEPSDKIMKKDALLYLLNNHKVLNGISIDTYKCKHKKGSSIVFYIDTVGYPVGKKLYWEVIKPNGELYPVLNNKGSFTTNDNVMEFSSYVSTDNYNELPFYIVVKESELATDYLTMTYKNYIYDTLPFRDESDFILYKTKEYNLEVFTMFYLCDNLDELDEVYNYASMSYTL